MAAAQQNALAVAYPLKPTYRKGAGWAPAMSVWGQKAKFRDNQRTSALAPKAEVSRFYEYTS